MRGLKRVRQGIRWLRSRGSDGAVILLYHRVAEPAQDPFGLCVSPARFEEHLQLLSTSFNVIPISDLVTKLPAGTLPPASVAVTFDDGYVDNLENAQPLLTRYHVPATVYVTSGCPGGRFWWDELATTVLTGDLPPKVSAPLGDDVIEWSSPVGTTAGRRRLLHDIHRTCLGLSRQAREALLQRVLACITGGDSGKARALDVDELVALARSDLVEIGAHTLSHCSLAHLSESDQRQEICGCKEQLQSLIRRDVRHFSYPFGRRSDYSRRTIEVVRGCGYESACTSQMNLAVARTGLFELPRLWVRNCPQHVLARTLTRWFGRRRCR